jgi:hypothetical protein
MTDRLASDIPVPHVIPMSPIDYYSFEEPPLPLEKKSRILSAVISNCGSRRRNQYIQAMLTYIHVDSDGHCVRNHSIGSPASRDPKERYS